MERSWIIVIFLATLIRPWSGIAQTSPVQPIDRIQIFSWLIGGISSPRLQRLIAERHLAFTFDESDQKQLESAGADPGLIAAVRKAAVSIGTDSAPCPPELLSAAKLAHQQKYSDAEDALRSLLRAQPQNADLHFALGEILRQQESWDDAFDEFTMAAHFASGFPEVHSRLAYLFYRSDDPDNAIAEARTALSIDPANAEAYRYLGLGLDGNGKYSAALHAYEESLTREPENADVYYDMGIAHRDRGDLRAAAIDCRHALRLRPDFWEAHNNLGIVLHDQGHFDEAVAEYLQAKRLAPEEPSVRSNLGNTYCDKGEFDAAVAEFRDLYRVNGGWDGGHNCLARAYMLKKKYPEAISELRVAVRENPTGAAEHRVLGQALLLDGKSSEAITELQAAVKLNPNAALSHHYLGTAFFETDQLHQAEQEFREALRLEPSADNHYALAACLMTMNRNDEALAELEVASRLDPGQKLYRARLEELQKLIKGASAH